MKIGVYVCHCGGNISEVVDVKKVTAFADEQTDVVLIRDHEHVCSEAGQKLISDDIAEHNLDRVVIAACSPQFHERTFRNTLTKAGLNPYVLEIANIREQCSWPHFDFPELATEKAKDLTNIAIAKARLDEPLGSKTIPVGKRVLVVGGGIAGIQAALDLGDAGFKVHLVEKEPSIGGKMAQLSRTFPTEDCAACILSPKMADVPANPNIKLHVYSDIEDISGYIGNFNVKIKHRSPFIDWVKCTACTDCAKVCPVNMKNEHDVGMTLRKAAYRPFDQAVPNKFTIDKQGEAPCRAACPVHLNAHGYVTATSVGEYGRALSIIREEAAFPFAGIAGRICTHPCQQECARSEVDKQPVTIKHVKRWLADWELSQKGEAGMVLDIPEPSGRKVAIVGAGPAGLQAAVDLRKHGHDVTVYDAFEEPGGMLRAGIPAFRLPREILEKECELVFKLGVKFKGNTTIGKDITLKKLTDSYDAVFLAVGAFKEGKMNIPGEDLEGVGNGVDFLTRINRGEKIKLGKRVAVVGGGNSAMDTARSALRMGADVTILYRRTEIEMPAIADEVRAAKAEGVKFMLLTNPKQFIGSNGTLKAVEVLKMKLGEPDESGRRRPIPIEGSEEILEFDNVFLAIGEKPDLFFISQEDGIDLTPWGTIDVDELTLATSHPKVFAGGDCVTGPATFIDAAGAGRKAARSINLMLEGVDFSVDRSDELFRSSDLVGEVDLADPAPLKPVPELDIAERTSNFNEVEIGYSEEDIVEQAKRCIHCGGCSECRLCVPACEPQAIALDLDDWSEEVEVDTIIVATGYDTFDAAKKKAYGYGKFENVITGLEMERIISCSGEGREIRPIGQRVAFIQCVGSRDEQIGNEYCSRICCMYSTKLSQLIKRADPSRDVYVFYTDLRSFGKGFEEYYKRAQETGVKFVRGRPAELFENPETKLITLKVEDTLSRQVITSEFDLVVLATGMVPARGTEEIADVLRLNKSPDGFLREAHPKFKPVDTLLEGIFVAGTVQGPKDIPDTVAQASAAASRAIRLMNQGEFEAEPITAIIDEGLCGACGTCVSVCPYDAVKLVEKEGKRLAEVNEVLCKGCGSCAGACPTGASQQKHYKTKQLRAMLDAVLARKE